LVPAAAIRINRAAVLAVTQSIVKNDSEAIRVAAKSVPDLKAAEKDGTTLLDFAVRQSWQRPESFEAVRTLLSLGADPNHMNGHPNSLAMADAGHSSAPVLRAMLEAGGNANTFAVPALIISWMPGFEVREVWYLSVGTIIFQMCVKLFLLRHELRKRLRFGESENFIPAALQLRSLRIVRLHVHRSP